MITQSLTLQLLAIPYAAVLFFHLTINAFLESLLGIKGFRSNRIERETGILGNVEAYIGTVEAQGRGTLHIHMLLWLEGSGRSQTMKNLLAEEGFRERVRSFISTNISADLPNVRGDAVLAIPREKRVAFSRPVDPRVAQYEENSKAAEKKVARTVQVHQCTQSCKKFVKMGYVCKRRAPWPLADEARKVGTKKNVRLLR